MSVTVYGVYLARFSFIESGAYKARPVVVVSQPRGEHKVMLCIPLSTNLTKEDVDVPIADWEFSGLLQPTVARVHRLTAILGSNILEYIGNLQQYDEDSIKSALQKVFEL